MIVESLESKIIGSRGESQGIFLRMDIIDATLSAAIKLSLASKSSFMNDLLSSCIFMAAVLRYHCSNLDFEIKAVL